MRNKILLFLLTFIGISQIAAASSVRDKYNFNSEWLLYVGDIPEAKEVRFQDTDWKKRYCFCFGEGSLRLRALQRTEGDSYLLLCRGLAAAAS
jgi:hypothetical protein